MQMRIIWGKIPPGQWDAFEVAFNRLPCRGQVWTVLPVAIPVPMFPPCQCRRGDGYGAHVCTMFSVDEATATAVRQVYEASGEFSAVVEFRRHFPGITATRRPRSV